jgi:hypothetical protein
MAHPNNQAQSKKPTTPQETAGNWFTVSGRQKRTKMFFPTERQDIPLTLKKHHHK